MLDFFKDIFAAFKQSSIERIKNPFIGAFAFSWIGFNWQVFAIILFSKKDVIDRIDYIKSNYDVGGFIFAPVLTAIFICLALPEANKLFTLLQKKPLDDTTRILMESKIAIAKEQLQIADIEAKKKLAQKREERNIEENIDAIKLKLDNYQEKIMILNDEISNLKGKNELEIGHVNALKKSNSELSSQIETLNTLKDRLLLDINERTNEVSNLKSEINKKALKELDVIESIGKLREKRDILKEEINTEKKKLFEIRTHCDYLIDQYPSIFNSTEVGAVKVRGYAKDALRLLDEKMDVMKETMHTGHNQ
ncbi:hypothetical protein [Serratia rhizosphaerae]